MSGDFQVGEIPGIRSDNVHGIHSGYHNLELERQNAASSYVAAQGTEKIKLIEKHILYIFESTKASIWLDLVL